MILLFKSIINFFKRKDRTKLVVLTEPLDGPARRVPGVGCLDPPAKAPLPCTLAWCAGGCGGCRLGFIYGNGRAEIDCAERQCVDEGGSQHMLSPVSVGGSFCVLREGLGHSTSSVEAL